MKFAEVEEHANRVARRLLELGIQPNSHIAVCLEKSVDAVIGVLGVLKAGGTWLPLDPGLSETRLRLLIEEAGAGVLLTHRELAQRLQPFAHAVVVLSLCLLPGGPAIEGFDVDADGLGRPLSFAQQRLWFFDQLSPHNPAYNIPVAVRLSGALDPDVLARCLIEIARRHDALRATLRAAGGRPAQVVNPEPQLRLVRIDLRDLPESERAAEARRILESEARRPFDLATGPLVTAHLVTTGDIEHFFLLNMHHIVSDGWSAGVLFRELAALYSAFTSRLPSPLPPLPIQYSDYAVWQHRTLRGAVLDEQIAWWRQALSGLPGPLELPTSFPRPAVQRHRGKTVSVTIPADTWLNLAVLARTEGATSFMALLAAYAVLLHRYSGQDDFVIGAPVAGRTRIELEGLIGFFVNTLALRLDLSGEPTFRDLLARARAVTLGALAHQDLPFDKLVEILNPSREQDRSPLVQVMLAFQNVPVGSLEFGGLKTEPLDLETDTSVFDLSLSAQEGPFGLRVHLRYDTDLFDQATATRMLSHLGVLIESIVRNPDVPIGRIQWLSPAERAQLIDGWNTRPVSRDLEQGVHARFAEHARRAADHVALVHSGGTVRYGELLRRAYAIAHALRRAGVRPEVPVGVHVERSPELVAGLLGVLFAGGAAVPLDPTLPVDRLLAMLQDARPAAVLSRSGLAGSPVPVMLFSEVDGSAAEPPATELTPEHLVYIVFTSGSTGRPKGVMIEHRGFTNLVLDQADRYTIRPESRVLQFFAPSFDGALSEIFLALCSGATLVLPPPEALLSGPALAGLLTAERVTFAKITPSMLRELPETELPDLTVIASAGEALTGDLVARWSRGRRFFNGYGPTEVTVGASVMDCTGLADPRPPIGRPWANKILYVVDRYLQPVPIGVPGELLVGGLGIARGYVGRPELTVERFLDDPFRPGGRVYRTGDRAVFLPDGNLGFLGRLDDQIKIRGYRVEPGEIEAALAQHPAVAAAAVVLRKDGGPARLVAYVVPRSQPAPDRSELIQHLRARVPDYMLPAEIVPLTALPRAASGKVDKAGLPAPARGHGRTEYVAPRSDLAVKVAGVWEEVLGVRPIGLHDEFFEVGGHSLLAVQLLNRLAQATGHEVPLAAFFRKTTVDGVCEFLQKEAVAWKSISSGAEGSRRAPFFCVHALGGGILCYTNLAKELEPDLPLHGLAAHGRTADIEPLDRIESMATAYLAEVRRVQPHGPYRLGGWSMGGLVAFEMARLLLGEGESVEAVVLIDSHLSDRSTDEPDDGLALAMALGLVGIAPRATFAEALAQARARGLLGDRDAEEQARRIVRVVRGHLEASRVYRPEPLDAPVTLLWAAERWQQDQPAPPEAWVPLCRRLSHHRVPGNHRTMLEEPQVRELARHVRTSLLHPVFTRSNS